MIDFFQKYQKKDVKEFPNEVFNTPLVSVCVQTYQHANFIKECLDGILKQKTSFEYELLLGEDESTDGTREICIEYAQKHPDKIRLFLHCRENVIKINNSPTGRFNFLYNIAHSRGKYIALCEGDDYWTDIYKLHKQVDFLESNPDFSVCFHESLVICQNKRREKFNKLQCNTIFTIKDLTQKNFISTASSVFRKRYNCIPDWLQDIEAGDWGLHFYNSTFGKIYYLADCMSVYRKHNGGVWSNLSREDMMLKGVEIMKKLDKASNYKYHDDFERGIRKRLEKIEISNRKKFVDLLPAPGSIDLYIIRRAILREIKRALPQFHGKLLDVGCGQMPYKSLLTGKTSRVAQYMGLDLEKNPIHNNHPDITWQNGKIPLADNTIDCAIATEVFEHCPNPEAIMSEICRVLKSGGVIFFTVPFLWPLHEVPYDEYRYTPFSLARHLDASGFVDIELSPLGGWDASLAQMLGLWVRRRRMARWVRGILSRLLVPVIFMLHQMDKRVIPHFIESTMITGLSGTARKNRGDACDTDS